ncbi:hypothetical protein HJC99_03815 [Candidatus Saccharibacteria bacterium]|nr:hypothetical protein [Candidatus Saccharibacteria bacterium]
MKKPKNGVYDESFNAEGLAKTISATIDLRRELHNSVASLRDGIICDVTLLGKTEMHQAALEVITVIASGEHAR